MENCLSVKPIKCAFDAIIAYNVGRLPRIKKNPNNLILSTCSISGSGMGELGFSPMMLTRVSIWVGRETRE